MRQPRTISLRVCLAIVGFCTLFSACAQRSGLTPQRAAKSFARALDDGDYARAHSLLDESLRASLSVDELEAIARRETGRTLVDTMHRIAAAPASLRARVALGAYRHATWVFADGKWKLVGDDFWAPDVSTPRAALRTFVEAAAARHYARMRAVAPRDYREQLTDEVLQAWLAEDAASFEQLRFVARAADWMPLQIQGNRAWLRYEDRVVSFEKVDDGWVIANFQ